MGTVSPVYEETYQHYLRQIKKIDLVAVSDRLNIKVDADEAIVPFVNSIYRVSGKGITGPDGRQPSLEFCVVLCKYLLMAPSIPVESNEWVSYRDLRDSGPLTVFWANEVEKKIEDYFTCKVDRLKTAGASLGGVLPQNSYPYDFSLKFFPLRKVPVLLLFNDKDDEFPAKSTLLLKKDADKYLDAESLAILGSVFAAGLMI